MWLNEAPAAILAVCACALWPVTGATSVQQVAGCPVVSDASCPDTSNIQFLLFTRSNPNTSQVVDLAADNLLQTNFNAANPTKIIIHGFTDNVTNPRQPENEDLRRMYLLKGDYNLIAVDWSILAAGLMCYKSAIENAKHVGSCVAQLVQRLRTAPTEDIHVIGHSLGAHIGGYIANHLKPYQLPRITGLDPAGPLFKSASSDNSLDAGDAIFVDVLHTNIYFFGKAEPCGHVDFYFNRDAVNQPGCGFDTVCSHYRSIAFFAESINTDKGFYGKKCSDFNKFRYTSGACSSAARSILMGEHTPTSTRGVVTVPTAAKQPFAVGI